MALLERRPIKLTYQDYALLPEDGQRHEILDGDHVVSPSPSRRHQACHAALFGHLWLHLQTTRSGVVLSAPFDVVLSEFDIVQPDLLYLANERRDLLTESHLAGAPDLVVEIVSESTRKRDVLVKRHLYTNAGVAEYWLVDPELETLTLFRGIGRLDRVAELGRGDTLETPLLPGFRLALDRLFD
jgi:Uma2 family endonuclease